MGKPTSPDDVRELIRGNKRLEYLVVQQIRLQRLTAHARDTDQSGARLYDDDLFPDAVDILRAYRTAVEIFEANPE